MSDRAFFRRQFWLVAVLLAGTGLQPVSGTHAPRGEYAETHLLVKLKAEKLPLLSAQSETEALTTLAAGLGLPPEARLEEPPVRRLLRSRSRRGAGPGAEAPVDVSRFLRLHLPPGMRVTNALQQLSRHGWVEYAEPDGIGTGGVIPSDPDILRQWHHTNSVKPTANIHTWQAWNITQGSSAVIVAMLDTGLNGDQPEFAGRVVPGYRFTNPACNTDTADDHGHGTMAAGILCASANNGVLGAGVDWHCRVMPIKVLDQNNSGYYSDWAQGIDYAVAQGAKVINLSAGGASSSITLSNAIARAIAKGVIFVTIAHNDGTNAIRFPGNLPLCITVGATDRNDVRAGFSNYGPEIDLVAPGVGITSVSRSGTLATWSGTSFAAPQVAGVCSLLAAVRPGLTQSEARALLRAGADDQVGDAADTPGFDPYYGWGRLNAGNTLLLAQTRIDSIWRLPNGQVVLSWPSPPNAGSRQPYRIRAKSSLTGAWMQQTSPFGFGYSTNRTYWTNTNTKASVGFFEVKVNFP